MNFRHFLYTHRPLCVAYETLRWVGHKTLGLGNRPTPAWYAFDKKPLPREKEIVPVNAAWYRISRPLYRHEHVFYNIENALAVNPQVKGIALIFFMGIGDYLYTTPMLEALKQKYPSLPFYGYVGETFDRNNSPLVGKLLEGNPNIEKVFYFKGLRHPFIWKNYDYSAALAQIPEGFLAVPVYYDYNIRVPHRVKSLFETFGLPIPQNVPTPKMYFPAEPSDVVRQYQQQIAAKAAGKKGIIFLQLDSRGSNYVYPHMKKLVEQLADENYCVVSVTKGGPLAQPAYVEIDIKRLAINETWHLLSLLKTQYPLYVIAVNSVFWAASAGLDLPNLGLQHWIDKKVHNLWYPNIQVVTEIIYPHLPREKQLLAPPESYSRHNRKIIDYKPDWIVKWFKDTFEK